MLSVLIGAACALLIVSLIVVIVLRLQCTRHRADRRKRRGKSRSRNGSTGGVLDDCDGTGIDGRHGSMDRLGGGVGGGCSSASSLHGGSIDIPSPVDKGPGSPANKMDAVGGGCGVGGVHGPDQMGETDEKNPDIIPQPSAGNSYPSRYFITFQTYPFSKKKKKL